MVALIQTEFVCEKMPVPGCHASTIVETSDGLAAAFFGGTKEGSDDVGIWFAGKNADGWTQPREVATGRAEDGRRYPCWNPVLFQPKKGPLMLFHKIGPNCADWWGMLMTSEDNGATWSKPRRLPDGVQGPAKNKPIQMDDGSVLCPASGEATGWRVFLERTSDLGETWDTVGPLNDGKDITAIQPSILVYPSGRMQLLCRTRQGYISTSWSEDDGRTWGPMELTCLPNPNSGIDAVMLSDGRAFLVYNHTGMIEGKWGGLRTPLNVAVSGDGVSWDAVMVLEDEKGEYSYPAVIQSSAGAVHITYTWRRTNIRHAIIDPAGLASQ